MNKSSLVLFLFCPLLLIAQEKDFQQWSKIGVYYDLNKDLSVSLDQAFRFRENASLTDVSFSNLALKYDIKKWSVAIGYRYITDFDLSQNTSISQRIYTDISYSKKKKRWRIKNRLRYQYQEENFTLRDKIFLKYNIRKTPLEPFTTFELFFKDSEFKKWRYTFGVSHPFLKEFEIEKMRIPPSFNKYGGLRKFSTNLSSI